MVYISREEEIFPDPRSLKDFWPLPFSDIEGLITKDSHGLKGLMGAAVSSISH